MLSCGKCLAGLEEGRIPLRIGCSTRLLSSGKPPNNHSGCQLWFLGYSCTVFFSCLSFIPAQYTVHEDAISQPPMHLTPRFLWKDNTSPFRLRQEHKALLSLMHSSPLPQGRERERHAACVMRRKDNVILLYGCYDYYFIIIIFYSGF